MNKERQHLLFILKHLKYVQDFTFEGQERFSEDIQIQFAAIRAYEVVGGTAKRIPKEFQEKYPQIDWRILARFHDFLSHYSDIELPTLWDAVEDVPRLKAEIQLVVDSLPPKEPAP